MRDYIELGESPADEPCAQVGSFDYPKQSRFETRLYRAMIERLAIAQFGTLPDSVEIRVKTEYGHDCPQRYVAVYFDTNDEKAIEIAFWLDNNTPAKWDKESKVALLRAQLAELEAQPEST